MTPNQICRSCTFWKPRDNSHLGECSRWDYRTSGDFDHSAIPTNGVIAENDEGWGALMGPEFGCVLWEEGTRPEPGQ